ncbi:MAG: hypothetical protein ACP5IB_09420 [Thermoplasmata archaeon]
MLSISFYSKTNNMLITHLNSIKRELEKVKEECKIIDKNTLSDIIEAIESLDKLIKKINNLKNQIEKTIDEFKKLINALSNKNKIRERIINYLINLDNYLNKNQNLAHIWIKYIIYEAILTVTYDNYWKIGMENIMSSLLNKLRQGTYNNHNITTFLHYYNIPIDKLIYRFPIFVSTLESFYKIFNLILENITKNAHEYSDKEELKILKNAHENFNKEMSRILSEIKEINKDIENYKPKFVDTLEKTINDIHTIVNELKNMINLVKKYIQKIGNCYKSKEEFEKVLKELNKIENILRDIENKLSKINKFYKEQKEKITSLINLSSSILKIEIPDETKEMIILLYILFMIPFAKDFNVINMEKELEDIKNLL